MAIFGCCAVLALTGLATAGCKDESTGSTGDSAAAATASPPGASPSPTAKPRCGEVLVPATEWFGGNGVDVRSNGDDPKESCGGYKTDHPEKQDGNGWQCIELAARFYHVHGWGAVYAYGNAAVDPDYREGAQYIPEGIVKNGSGLKFYENGQQMPVAGDLIIETDSTFGHVAVIDKIVKDATVGDRHGVAVLAVEQNFETYGRHTYWLDGLKLTDGHGTNGIRGIVHEPKNHGVPSPTRSPSTGLPLATGTDWRNTTYVTNCAGESKFPISVKILAGTGQAIGSRDPGAPYEFSVEAVAPGDLTRDGRPEVAVILMCTPPSTNFFVWEIQVFTDGPRLLTDLVVPPLPDALYPGVNAVPNEFSIRDGALATGLMYYGPKDCHACGPSIHSTVRWRWDGAHLVRAG